MFCLGVLYLESELVIQQKIVDLSQNIQTSIYLHIFIENCESYAYLKFTIHQWFIVNFSVVACFKFL
jgi:hypothetical protein